MYIPIFLIILLFFALLTLDVQTPRIICPLDVEVITNDWLESNVTLENVFTPTVTDNSGEVIYSVSGVTSDDGTFYIGTTILTYEAVDSAGNTARCTQNIIVKGELSYFLVFKRAPALRKSNKSTMPLVEAIENHKRCATKGM